MKGIKRLLASVLVVFMTLGVLSGCRSGSGNKEVEANNTTENKESGTGTKSNVPGYMNAAGYPIVKEPVTLKAMVMKTGSHANYDYAGLPIWSEYEKISGVKIEFEQVINTAINEKRNLAFASGDLPDIFFRCNIPDADVDKYGEQGMLIKLNELIDSYAPNMKSILATMPEIKKGITSANGNIYALQSSTDSFTVETSRRLFINKNWLAKVGMKMPTTTDEFYHLLKAFKDKDANGNGKADEVPFTGQLWGALDCIRGAWGLGNRGYSHGNVDMDEKTGKLRFMPISNEYKEFLQYANKLYKEGLLDEELFTMDGAKLIAKGEQNIVGAFGGIINTLIGGTYAEDFEGIQVALKGPNGDQLWPNKRPRLTAKGAFAITNKCKYPEVAMRWIDYFYGDDGIKHLYLGVEGKTFKKNADGTYEYLESEIIKNEPAGTKFDQVIAKFFAWSGGYMPTLIKTEYFRAGETMPINVKAAENMKPYFPKEIWSAFTYTQEEREKMQPIETDVIAYVTQMVPQFIAGKASFAEWDSYVEKIKKMGIEDYLKIYQAAYERYNKN